MNCSTGNKMSDAVAELNITGNVIPSVSVSYTHLMLPTTPYV